MLIHTQTWESGLLREVDLDRLQEIDHVRSTNEIKENRSGQVGRDLIYRPQRAPHDRMAVVGFVLRQTLLTPAVDVELVAMGDAIAQMVD